MDYYIIRIYDRESSDGKLIGTIEDAEGRQARAFQSPEHLLCFLRGEAPQERRVTGRLPLVLPVTVEGTNSGGERFTEDSFLENISHRGAFIPLKNKVALDEVLSLVIDPERSAYAGQARVVRREPAIGAPGCGIGVRLWIKES